MTKTAVTKLRVRTVRMTDSQYAKYLSLGGSSWLRLTLGTTKKSAVTERLRKMRESGVQTGERHELAR